MRGLIRNGPISRKTNKSRISKPRRLPHKSPYQPLKIPRYLFPHARHLIAIFPESISRLIICFTYLVGPKTAVNADVIHEYSVAERFYKAVLYGGLRVSESLMWLPAPYYHPLRDEAVKVFINIEIPWVNNEGEISD